mmetsp:Transcript_132150/g.263710  ORF Transcript_132150/g.263710 Transcript_132150/m.263710 type:complete len:524 (-) Transcript_132150:127-1698(-)
MTWHSNVRCNAFFMLLLMAVTADKAVAERVDQDDNNLPNVPTVASYGEKGNFDFDVFIIGAGSGGIRLAKTLSREKDLKVGIAESRDFGGTCVNRGCNPKKTLVAASAFYTEIEQATANDVWEVAARLKWDKLQQFRAKKVSRVANFYKQGLVKAANVEVFEEPASVVGQHEIKIGSATKRVRLLVVCTGGKPRQMDIPGAELENVITSDEALELESKPKSMLVVGAGYIAVELASFFLQVGTDVTMAVRSSLLKSFDTDVSGIIEDSLLERGLKVQGDLPVEIVQAEDVLNVTMADGTLLQVEYVLQAIGRDPLTANLGLNTVGVNLDEQSKVPVNKYGQTSAPWIFAIGDIVAKGLELQPVAVKQADHLVKILLRGPEATTAPTLHPPVPPEHVATALFATPRAGSVGLTEQEADAKYPGNVTVLVEKTGPCCTPVFQWGLLKVLYHTPTERLLGIHIAGKGADELVQAFGIVMAFNPTWSGLQSALAVHPTATEYIVFMNKHKSFRKGKWRRSECSPCQN